MAGTSVDTDVLIVGAGPTGLMLANQLARHGVRPLIIDRHAGPARETRALGVHARTLEIYAQLGIVRQALALGQRGDGVQFRVAGKPAARMPLGDIGQGLSPYPFILILGQDDNERLLGDLLHSRGVAVQWNTELVGLDQQPQNVVAELRQPDGSTRRVSARWVAGCDGTRSAVRNLNGIGFPGGSYEHVFFVADTTVTGNMRADALNVHLSRTGFHLFFPMKGPDHWRIVGILPDALHQRTDVTFADVVPGLQQEAGADLRIQGCSWFSTYRIHHRRAARFRDRRCFLLGDAAHVHSPVGAQGMNMGLQDAYNFGWKLARVATGRAGPGLLDSYEAERIPVAERLLRTTDRAFALLVSARPLAAFIRLRLIPRLLGQALRLPAIRRLVFRTVSQTGIRYPQSPLSRTLPGLSPAAPRPGDRFPWLRVRFVPGGPVRDLYEALDDTRFNLVAIGVPAPEPAWPPGDSPLHVISIPFEAGNAAELRRAGITRPAAWLLRPDGHVGLAGGRLAAGDITTYLQAPRPA